MTVKVEDVDKGVTRNFTSDGAGLYDTGPIVPDRYLLTFTKEGFQTYVRGPITLAVGIQPVDVQLTVGSATADSGSEDGCRAADDGIGRPGGNSFLADHIAVAAGRRRLGELCHPVARRIRCA